MFARCFTRPPLLLVLVCATLTGCLLLSNPARAASPWNLWYEAPAAEWTDALPVGNGRLGAMVFGGKAGERIQFNDDTLWTGAPHDYSHPGAKDYLAEVRRLLFEGKQLEADALALEKMMSVPLRQERYQPFGDILLTFPGHENASNYRRDLDLDTAVATVQYVVGDVTYKRSVFSSAVDDVLVVRLEASKPGALTFDVALDCPHPVSLARPAGGDRLTLQGGVSPYFLDRDRTVHPSILVFAAQLRVLPEGGSIKADIEKISVKDANTATLILAGNTNYKNYKETGGDPLAACEATLDQAVKKSAAQLAAAHTADHRALFRRVDIDLGETAASKDPTDVRLAKFNEREDPGLVALYFQYGRYLLIASSRPGTQPANLQGIWNDSLEPPWDSKWTVNINTEMNYWPVEVANLSECAMPLFDMLDEVAQTGARVAKVHYGADGWVLHHNTDLWRGAAPINAANHGIWVTGGAWLCTHLWEHYLFTGDKEFLSERAYPLMKGASEFFLDFLIEDPRTGYLISTPSNSPENGGLVAGPTMDHEIIRDLMGYTIETSKLLGVDADFRDKLTATRARIAPSKIGRLGQLQEWLEDIDDPNNKHRHVSHLYGLYPSHQITLEGTPDLAAAARKSLEMRGDEGTGWSMSWKINLWARLHEGDHAYMLLMNQLRPEGAATANYSGRGGSYNNLFDAHPPFQIDGNFGGAAGIAEMLLQSHTGAIELLPALPSAWPSGAVEGLRARGAYTVDIHWDKGTLTKVRIVPSRDGVCNVRYGEKKVSFDAKAGNEYRLDANLKM